MAVKPIRNDGIGGDDHPAEHDERSAHPPADQDDHADDGEDEQQRRRGGERRARRVRLQRVRAEHVGQRAEADDRQQALEADRVRPQVLHHRGRQEPGAEEAAVVAGEPRGARRALQRQQLTIGGEVEQRAELGLVQPDVDERADHRRAERTDGDAPVTPPQQQADAGDGDERADADRRPGEQGGEGEAGGPQQGAPSSARATARTAVPASGDRTAPPPTSPSRGTRSPSRRGTAPARRPSP